MTDKIPVKQIINLLFQYLSPICTEHGFKPIKSKRCFKLLKNNCEFKLHIIIKDYYYHEIDFAFSIYIRDIAEILTPCLKMHPACALIKPEEWDSDRPTLSIGLNRFLTDSSAGFCSVYTEEQLLAEMPNIVKNIQQHAFSFFDNYSDLQFLNKKFNIDFERGLIFPILTGAEILTPLVIAKLCNHPNYNELVETYRPKYLGLLQGGNPRKEGYKAQIASVYDCLVERLKTVQPLY